MRLYIARLLEEQGWLVGSSLMGTPRCSVHEKPPDLVLADVMMPGLDGFGCCVRCGPISKRARCRL
jgi:DNA-binding response OmpR family regulator